MAEIEERRQMVEPPDVEPLREHGTDVEGEPEPEPEPEPEGEPEDDE